MEMRIAVIVAMRQTLAQGRNTLNLAIARTFELVEKGKLLQQDEGYSLERSITQVIRSSAV